MTCDANHCITCGDDGIPMTVLQVDGERMLALCEDADGARSSVEIALVEPVAPGDTVLVHAGTALSRLAGGHATVPGREAGCLAEVTS